jgi:hypothetical protein
MKSDQEIVVKGYFPPSETNISMQQDFQQGKVFQSFLSSPENDVVVQFLSGLDMDEDSETASMETSSSEQTNYIEFQERNKTAYAIFQSEIQKDNEEEVVLFDSFENHGCENASMGTLDCEIIHDVRFSHLQEYYEHKLISIHSFEIKMTILKQISRRLIKPNQNHLMYKRITLMHIVWLSYLNMFKDV